MYLPKHFEESRPEVLHRFIEQHPLATLIVGGTTGLAADHIPLFLHRNVGAYGELIGHVARNNPLWQKAAEGIDCLVIFHGGDRYISPNWYSTKAQDGKAVPTWNYEVVHVQGKLFAVDDASWLRDCLAELTARHEASQPKPWKIEDAPSDFIEARLAAVVGIRIEIGSLIGKAKLSQNQAQQNRWSVIDALRTAGDEASIRMADSIARRDEGAA